MSSTRCPRCGQANRCAQADQDEPVQDCWCFHVPIAPQVLQALPAEARDQACLCPRCASAQGEDEKSD